MLVLALDTATAATSVALVDLDRTAQAHPLAARHHVDPRAHGERLGPQIVAVLAQAGHRPRELAAIVAGTGPGPFTGLRVGLATATAMAQALGIPTYGVCSLDAVAPADPEPVLVATDARRREIYWAVYRDGQRLAGPAVDSPAQAAELIAAHQLRRAYGEGALRYAEVLGLPVAGERERYPDPMRLAVLAASRIVSGEPGEPLVPLYLRRPDATSPPATAVAMAAPAGAGQPAPR